MATTSSEAIHLRNVENQLMNSTVPGVSTGADFINGTKSAPAQYFNQTRGIEQRLSDYAEAVDVSKRIGLAAPAFDQGILQIQQQRKAEQELLQFDRFVESVYDPSDPATAALLKGMYPEYLAKREQYIKDRHKLSEMAALLQLRGPQNKDELVHQYLIESGQVKVPTLSESADVEKEGFKRGLFNVNKWAFSSQESKQPFTAGMYTSRKASGAYKDGNLNNISSFHKRMASLGTPQNFNLI